MKVTGGTRAGYPTLEELLCDRREFLERLARAGVAAGVAGGLIAGCEPGSGILTAHGASGDGGEGPVADGDAGPEVPASPGDAGSTRSGDPAPRGDADGGSTGRRSAQGDSGGSSPEDGASPGPDDAGVPDDGDAGQPDDTAAPDTTGAEIFVAHIPSDGVATVYLKTGGYAGYKLVIQSTSAAFHAAYHGTVAGQTVADGVIASVWCGDLGTGGVASITATLQAAFEQHFAALSPGSPAGIVSLALSVPFCEQYAEIDGDLADLSFP
ncbi:MAG: hypothetical protein AMXMBFR64_30170 [Myxococcales bacterium]